MSRRAVSRSGAATTAAATTVEKSSGVRGGRSFRCRLLALKKEGLYSVSSWASDFHIAVPTEIKSGRPSSLSPSPAEHVSFFKGLPARDALLKYPEEEKNRVVGGIAGGGCRKGAGGVGRQIHMSNLTPERQTQFPAHV